MADQDSMLGKVRALLAKAEDEGVTPQEAEALTAKAAELMAKYGIDRARLAATRPETDKPASKIIDVPNPWAQVRAHLLSGLAGAMRCQPVLLDSTLPETQDVPDRLQRQRLPGRLRPGAARRHRLNPRRIRQREGTHPMSATNDQIFLTPGHPAGCCCGECDVRRRHVEGAPGHQRCGEHGRCIGCDGCTPCEMDTQRGNEIDKQVTELPDLIRKAQRAVNDVRASFEHLNTDLYDIEIAEGPEGADALYDLHEILRRLRNIKRIADARRAIAEQEA